MLSSRLQAHAAPHRPYVVAGMGLLGACWAPATVAALTAALSIRLSSGLVHLVRNSIQQRLAGPRRCCPDISLCRWACRRLSDRKLEQRLVQLHIIG